MIKSRKGELSLYYVLFLLALSCALFPVYEYFCVYEEGQEIRAKVQTDLNAYASSSCVNSVDSLKDGKLPDSPDDLSSFENQECGSLGLSRNAAGWSSGSANYAIRGMSTQIKDTGRAVVLFTQYQLVIPVKLLNMPIAKPVITQTAESYLAEKYFSANQFEDKYLKSSFQDDFRQTPEKTEYTITVKASEGGTASVNKPVCSNLETCTVTAVPAQYEKFVEWRNSYGIPVSKNPVDTFTPSADTVLTAVFAGAVPESPAINLTEFSQTADGLREISLSIDCPEENENLADTYTVQLAPLQGYPYSSLSEDGKKSFLPFGTWDLLMTLSGEKISDQNYDSCSVSPEGIGRYKVSAKAGFGENGLSCDYIAVGAYGTGHKGNGTASVKVYRIKGSEISLADEYQNAAVPSDGIPGILRTR